MAAGRAVHAAARLAEGIPLSLGRRPIGAHLLRTLLKCLSGACWALGTIAELLAASERVGARFAVRLALVDIKARKVAPDMRTRAMPPEGIACGPGTSSAVGEIDVECIIQPSVDRLKNEIDGGAAPCTIGLLPARGVEADLEAAPIVLVRVAEREAAILAVPVALLDCIRRNASAAEGKQDSRAACNELS